MSKTLKILSLPQGNAEEYGRWSVNPYKGCSHNCTYCYLKKGVWKKGLGGDTAELKSGVVNEEHAYHLAMADIIEHRDEIIRDGGLFMTFTSDPCAEQTYKLFFHISESAREMDIPVTMLTKAGPYYLRMFCDSTIDANCILNSVRTKEQEQHDYLNRCKEKASLLAVGFTLTGHDELEPNAISNEERIERIDFLAHHCPLAEKCHLWASIEPVIDFPSSLDMIYQALNAGCQHFKIGLLTNNTRVVRKDFQIGEYQFKAYDVRDCLHFIEDVMRLTSGKATVYWKQSVRDLLGTDLETKIDEYPHSVGKDWSMFTSDVR